MDDHAQKATWRSLLTRERVGWITYDWANSAFALCVITVVGSGYFVGIFDKAAAQMGATTAGGISTMNILGMNLPAGAAWSFIIFASALFVALTSPFMGVIADDKGAKKRFLAFYCGFGALATVALWFSLPWWAVGLLILIGNIGFEGGNVFYNAFLPEIADPGEQDMVSSAGFAVGYIGGVLVLIVALFAFILPSNDVHTPFLLIGVWWAGFAAVTLSLLSESPGRGEFKKIQSMVAATWQELSRTVSHIRDYPNTGRFLIAFLLYNDGVMTIITNATPFALQYIYLDNTLTEKVGLTQLIPVIIMVQIVASPGALCCGWLATRFGEQPAIFFTLSVYTVVVAYGQVVQTLSEFYVMAALIGVVLGGVQAISRSLFASLIPAGKSAEFFSFYALSGKFSSVFGPLIYFLSVWLTGSARLALLSLTVFFIAGGVVLYRVDVPKGRAEAAGA
ncbi:MAG: MFS transporter [bacterium]